MLAVVAGLVTLALAGPHARWFAGAAAALGLYAASLLVLELVVDLSRAALETDFERGHTVVSVVWAVSGLGLLLAGIIRRSPAVRYAGLALFGVTLGKIFLFDLAELSSVARAVVVRRRRRAAAGGRVLRPAARSAGGRHIALAAILADVASPDAAGELERTIDRYNEAWNAHDVDLIVSFHAPGMVFENHTAGERAEGPDVRGHLAEIFANWPDLAFRGRRLYACDGLVVSEWTATATAADGRRLEWDGIDVFPFENGLILRKDVYSAGHRPRLLDPEQTAAE